MSYSRREITFMSVAVAAVSALHGRSSAAQDSELAIIDTHQHLWDLVQFQPPWLNGADAKIAAKHDTADYLAETTGLNIVKAVYMEVDVAPADQVKEAEYVLALIQSGKTPTVGAVISGRPNSDNFASYIAKFKVNPLIKGVRQVLHAPTAQRALCLQPRFVRSIQLLGEMGKSFDLCMRPTELADGAQLAAKCPHTQFIVDHCGNADPQAWRAKEKQTVNMPAWAGGAAIGVGAPAQDAGARPLPLASSQTSGAQHQHHPALSPHIAVAGGVETAA